MLSRTAKRETELSELMSKSVQIISEALRCTQISIYEASPDNSHFCLKSCSNADNTTPIICGLATDTQTIEPIVSDDFTQVSVPISGITDSHTFGLLQANAETNHCFQLDDIEFLHISTGIIATAIHRNHLETLLKNKVLELHLAHRKKDDFLANLSHELRNPLNVILGFFEMIHTMDRNSTEFDEALGAIERNAKSEARLVLDLLDVSRFMTGKMCIERRFFALTECLESALSSIRLTAQAKGIHVSTSYQHGIDKFYGDKDRILQVILNLLSNAIKFTPSTGLIKISTILNHDVLELAVQDSGIGIAEENIPHVFDRFWQEDSGLNRQHQGMGLGLSIVKQIVELHGGTVTVESIGRSLGTCFKVRLPIVQAEDNLSQEDLMPEPRLLGVENIDFTGRHVLVIDDSEDSLTLTKVLLETRGASVHATSSPIDGLHEATSQNFDLIIADIGMPLMDGYTLIKNFREWEKSAGRTTRPAIALSGFASDADKLRAINAGFSCHLTKPLIRKDFEATIHRELGGNNKRDFQRSTIS
jgi:signal transduction histidine kinase/ActR/RegA family two-component response regulator